MTLEEFKSRSYDLNKEYSQLQSREQALKTEWLSQCPLKTGDLVEVVSEGWKGMESATGFIASIGATTQESGYSYSLLKVKKDGSPSSVQLWIRGKIIRIEKVAL